MSQEVKEAGKRLGSVVYNPNVPHSYVGYNSVITYNPFTNHLLISWEVVNYLALETSSHTENEMAWLDAKNIPFKKNTIPQIWLDLAKV